MILARYGLLVTFVLGILILGFAAYAQEMPSSLSKLDDSVNQFESVVDKSPAEMEEESWNYLSEKWREFLKKSVIFSSIDSFLKKRDIIFVILFGESYIFSLTFFLVIICWIYIAVALSNIVYTLSPFEGKTHLIVGFGLTVISAQFGIIRATADLLFKFFFFKEGVWGWLGPGTLLIIAIGFVFILRVIRAKKKKSKERRREEQRIRDERDINVVATGLREGQEGGTSPWGEEGG